MEEIHISENIKNLYSQLNRLFKANLDYHSEFVVTLVKGEEDYTISGNFIGVDNDVLIADINLVKYWVLKTHAIQEEVDKQFTFALLNSIINKDMFKRENLTIRNNNE